MLCGFVLTKDLWRYTLGNKQLQYTDCSISQEEEEEEEEEEVKTIREWNLVNQWNIKWRKLFLKNHAQNVVEKLLPDLFLKNQNWAYL